MSEEKQIRAATGSLCSDPETEVLDPHLTGQLLLLQISMGEFTVILGRQ